LVVPDVHGLGEDEEKKSDDDETRPFSINDFKEKAEKYAKDNYDKLNQKKKGGKNEHHHGFDHQGKSSIS